MAKKVRRPRSASPERYSSSRPAPAPTDGMIAAAAAAPAIRSRGSMAEPAKKVNFAEEYHYVYQDLRRVAMLAGTILLILVVLGFVIK
jgi:hypothetical protein